MRNRIIVSVVSALPLLASHASAQSARASSALIAATVDSLANRAIAAGLAPALGLAITRDGSTILRRAYGMADVSAQIAADANTLWYLASTSKSLTGFGASLLAEQGSLRFETPITTLLPGATWHASAKADSLTLAHFLSHTHQLNDNAVVMSAAFTGAIPEAEWPSLVALAAPRRTPDLVYSNFGYNVAAMVIDRVRPEGWRRYLEANVYTPAGMRNTFARISGLAPRRIARPHRLRGDGAYVTETFFKTDATMNSAGGHLATLDDLARWTIVQMDSGVIDGRRVFPAAAVALSQTLLARQTREQAKRFAYFDRDGWGAGWDLGSYAGERMVSRFGGYSSFRSHLSFLPQRRIGVVAITTGGLGASLTDLLAAFAYDLDAGRADAQTSARERLDRLIEQLASSHRSALTRDSMLAIKSREPLGRPATDFAAAYDAPGYGTLVIRPRGVGLQYRWGMVHGLLVPDDLATGRFAFDVAGTDMVLVFDSPATGVVQSLFRRSR